MARRKERGERRRRPERGRRRPAAEADEHDEATPPPPPLDEAEKRTCESVLRETIELEGYEALDLAVRPDRSIAVVLDCERKPVTLGSCTFMNRRLRQALEGAGLPADHYAIEVASPGTRRPLRTRRHFERFAGDLVRLKIRQPDGGALVLRGQLIALRDDVLRFEPRDAERIDVALDDVLEARLDPYQDEERG